MPIIGKKHSGWNYRVVAQTIDGEPTYGIHECYYEPTGWTANPVPVVAETVDGLREQLIRMAIALDLDVIHED